MCAADIINEFTAIKNHRSYLPRALTLSAHYTGQNERAYIMRQEDYYVPDARSPDSSRLYGIGGWLIVFILRLGLNTLALISSTVYLLRQEFEALTFFFFIAVICHVFTVITFFSKKLVFRRWYIITAALYFLISLPESSAASVIGGLIGEALWITYLFTSKRVANTFTDNNKEYTNPRGHNAGPIYVAQPDYSYIRTPSAEYKPDLLDELELITEQKHKKLISESEFKSKKTDILNKIYNMYQ